MVVRLQSALLAGVEAEPCEVEVDLDDRDLHRETVVGLPDASVRESLERVRSAIGNAGYPYPQGRLLINLAPADVRKAGPVYDLPIALGLLAVQGVIRDGGGGPSASGDAAAPVSLRSALVVGELALDGRVRPVNGVIAMAALAKQRGLAASPRRSAARTSRMSRRPRCSKPLSSAARTSRTT
jgi:magnesium chelatase family protein